MKFNPFYAVVFATFAATPALAQDQARCAAEVFSLTVNECTSYGGVVDQAAGESGLSLLRFGRGSDEFEHECILPSGAFQLSSH